MNAEQENSGEKIITDEHSVKIEIIEINAPKLSETATENKSGEIIPETNSNPTLFITKESEPEDKQVAHETSSNSLLIPAEENKNEQDKTELQFKSEDSFVTTKVQTEEASKPEIFVNRPLCADYRSDSSSDSDSDSSPHSSLSYNSDNASSSDDSPSNEQQDNKKKRNADYTDLSLCDLPPIENLKITVPEDECQEIGTILNIVGTLVVIQAYKSSPALDIDSILFLERGQKSLGKIFDVLGPISEPIYTVRFNSKEEITKNDIIPDMKVYCAPKTKYTSFVFVSELMKMRGSDASWKNNEEAPSEFQDFSDDEEEQKFKKGKNDPEKKEQLPPSTSSSSSFNWTRKKVKTFHPRTNPQSNYRNMMPPNPHRPIFSNPRSPANPNNHFCINPQFPPFSSIARNPFFNPAEAPQPNPTFRCPPQMFGFPFRPPVPPLHPQSYYPQYPQRFTHPQYMWPPQSLPVMPPSIENIPQRPPHPMVFGANMANRPN